MNAFDLYEGFSGLSDELIERSEKTRRNVSRKAVPAIAAIAAVVAVVIAIPMLRRDKPAVPSEPAPPVDAREPAAEPEPPQSPSAPEPEPSTEPELPSIYFNDASEWSFLDAAPLAKNEGIFTETMTDEELAAIGLKGVPESFPELRIVSADALYLTSGELMAARVVLSTDWGEALYISVSPEGRSRARDALIPDGQELKTLDIWEGKTFIAWEQPQADKLSLNVDIEYDTGAVMSFHTAAAEDETLPDSGIGVPMDDAGKARHELTKLMYALGRNNAPDMSGFKMREEHFFRSEEMTFDEARSDEEFGAYIPSAAPKGFKAELFWRYLLDDIDNHLRASFCSSGGGYGYLDWYVTYATAYDMERLTGADELENYDLSLYPIPRADSVPEDKRLIVNNPVFRAEDVTMEVVMRRVYDTYEAGDSGIRMEFSVLYGDVIVRISSKGVPPEWVYEQIANIG